MTCVEPVKASTIPITDRPSAACACDDAAPVDTTPPRTQLRFPFNIRLLMAGWNLLYLDRKPFTPDPNRSAEWNRGGPK